MRARSSAEELAWRKKLGDKIRRMIHIRGTTQRRLAYELGMNEAILSRYITGARTPSSYLVAKIARILDCDIEWLYDVDN